VLPRFALVAADHGPAGFVGDGAAHAADYGIIILFFFFFRGRFIALALLALFGGLLCRWWSGFFVVNLGVVTLGGTA
jgi:hypothetical protein